MFLSIYLSQTCTNIQVIGYRMVFFLVFFPLHLDLPFPFISSHKSSESYTWRAKIVLLGLLSHLEHTSKLYPVILVVPPLFMVISSLMRPKEWLSCIKCGRDGFYTLFSSSFSSFMPSLLSFFFDVLTLCASHNQCSYPRSKLHPWK